MNTKLLEWKENKSGCFSEALGFRYQILEWRTSRTPTYIASFHTDRYGSGKLQEDETLEICKEACQSHHEAILAAVDSEIIKRAGGYSIPCMNCGGEGIVRNPVSNDDYQEAQCLCCNATGNTYVIPAPMESEAGMVLPKSMDQRPDLTSEEWGRACRENSV